MNTSGYPVKITVFFFCLALSLFLASFGLTETKQPVKKSVVEKAAKQMQKKDGQQAAVKIDPDKDRKPSLEWGNQLYHHYCIPCHGIRGDGHGFNAPHLLVKPANHTDSASMSKRSDQKLFDTINLGGVEVAKSTLMPPWGAALNNDNKIKSLIMKLRDLCQCQATKNW